MEYPAHSSPYSSAPYDQSHTFAFGYTSGEQPSLFSGIGHDFDAGDLESLEGQRHLAPGLSHTDSMVSRSCPHNAVRCVAG